MNPKTTTVCTLTLLGLQPQTILTLKPKSFWTTLAHFCHTGFLVVYRPQHHRHTNPSVITNSLSRNNTWRVFTFGLTCLHLNKTFNTNAVNRKLTKRSKQNGPRWYFNQSFILEDILTNLILNSSALGRPINIVL